MENYNREVRDICNIFKEITGAESEPLREAGVLVPFIKAYHWQAYDFRLVIEHSMKDSKTKEFMNQPGRMNLRSIFGSHRVDLVLDIHADLKRAKEIQLKREEQKEESPDVKVQRLLLRCGCIYERRYIKIPLENNPSAKYRWKWTNQEEYEHHICAPAFEAQKA